MRELPQRTAERVVFLVIERILKVVACADRGRAVVGVGFVGVEVYFSEKSGLKGWLVLLVYERVWQGGDALLLVMLELADHGCEMCARRAE